MPERILGSTQDSDKVGRDSALGSVRHSRGSAAAAQVPGVRETFLDSPMKRNCIEVACQSRYILCIACTHGIWYLRVDLPLNDGPDCFQSPSHA